MFDSLPLRTRMRFRLAGRIVLALGVTSVAAMMLIFADRTGPWHLAVGLSTCAVGAMLASIPGRERPAETPRRYLFLVMASSFFTFGSLGTLFLMVFAGEPQNFFAGLVAIALGGTFACLWTAAFSLKKFWLVPVAILAQIFVPQPLFGQLYRLGLLRNFGDLSEQTRTGILAFLTIGTIVIGYVLSIRLTSRITSESVRAQAELDVAQRVHASIVPDIAMAPPGYEILGISRPSTEMGGDLIDVVGGPGGVDVFLADVSGHGVGAGVVMGMVKSALRTRLLAGSGLVEVVADLNRVITSLVTPGMFVTMVSVRLTPGRAQVIGAGHPPVFHVSARSGVVGLIPSESMPVGIDGHESFAIHEVRPEPGDLFVLYTDGLTEVMDDGGTQLGIEGVREAVRANAARPLHEIRDAVFAAAAARGRQADDQSLVLVRVV